MKLATSFFALTLSLIVSANAQETTKKIESSEKGTTVELARGKLQLQTPADWKKQKPRSRMTQYEFSAPAKAKEGEKTARITITQAGGSIPANIDRWKGQFANADTDKTKLEKFEAAKQTIHVLDIQGDFNESMGGGPFAPGKIVKREGYRMIGAIVETKGLGTYFVKMTGPQEVVKKLADDMKKMLKGLEAK